MAAAERRCADGSWFADGRLLADGFAQRLIGFTEVLVTVTIVKDLTVQT